LAVVVVEPARVGGHDLEPVLALLQALHDRLGQQVLPLLPVARLERPGLLLGGGGERAGGENGRAETHAELHSVSPRVGGAPRALAEAVVAGYGGIGIDGRQRTERAERGEEIRDRTLRPRVAGRVGPAALAAHGGHPALPLRQLDARDRGGRNSKEGRGLGGG